MRSNSVFTLPIITDSPHLAVKADHKKKFQFYSRVFPNGKSIPPKPTEEFKDWVRTNLPDQYKLDVINSNVESMNNTAFTLLKDTYEKFMLDPKHGKVYFKYMHDNVHYFGQIYHNIWTDTTTGNIYKNFNIKLNNDGYLFVDPSILPGCRAIHDERHQARGWVTLSRSNFDRLPALVAVAESLLGAGKVVWCKGYYNLQEEMIDFKLADSDKNAIVFTFERYGIDKEIVLDDWEQF